MKKIQTLLFGSFLAFTTPALGEAFKPGESDFVFLSDLANAGFKPIALSNAGSASLGMAKKGDIYFCFLADNDQDASNRRSTISAVLNNVDAKRTVPNIPVVCILTQ